LIKVKFSWEWSVDPASTSEGIQLDETAVGAMGIEWTRGVTLYGAEEERGVAGERGVRKSAGFGTSKARDWPEVE